MADLDKFKCKRDLYDYMTKFQGYWLPKFKSCRLSFLQQIALEKKKVVLVSDDNFRLYKVDDKWAEWAVRNIYPKVKDNLALREYLPHAEMDQNWMPDWIWFWGVLIYVLPVWSKQYYDSVVNVRHNQVPAFKAVQKIEVSEKRPPLMYQLP